MQRASVRQLECIVAIADHGSFRRAAHAIALSQPALSMQVQALEQLLGTQIFERDRRSVLITPTGQELIARARDALASIDAVGDAARRRGRPLVGRLRMGVIPTVAPYWLSKLLPPVRARFPELTLVLREDFTHRLVGELTSGQLDVALLALPVSGDFTAARLCDEPFVVAVPRSSPLARRRALTQRDLEGETVLLLEDGHCLRDQALAVCSRVHAVESVEVRATSLPTLVHMVAGGLGITLLPLAAADALVPRRGPIAVVPFARPAPSRTLGLVWRTSSARLGELRLLADTMIG